MLLPASLLAAQAGDLDPRFGARGKVVIDIGGSGDEGQDVALQSDGKIVMSGFSSNVATGFVEFAVARFLPDGNLDTSFGGDGIVTTSFEDSSAINHAVALQRDGKIIAAGGAVGTSGASFALARYLPDGRLDKTFSGDGKVTIDVGGREVNALVMQPDGKIVAVGTTALARFRPNGALDATFGTAGVVSVDFEQLAAVRQPDGKIVTSGQVFNASTSQNEFALARFLSNGTLDTTFGGDGRVNTDVGGTGAAWAVALQADGKVIAAGNPVSVADGHRDFGLVRYLPNGALDKTFSDDGLVTTSFGADDSSRIRGLVIQPNDGRLVAAGDSTLTGEGGHDFALARYESRIRKSMD